MKTLLHLNSSPRGNYSVSRKLSSEVVAAWKATNPEGKVIERDLAKSHLTFVNLNWILGAFTPPENHSEAHKKALAVSDELVAELLASDVIVIGTPMYNFAVPAALKAWIDHIVRFGKTFSYKPNGVEGHAGGRKVIVTVASGGVYAGTPLEAYDHEIPYLRHIPGFIWYFGGYVYPGGRHERRCTRKDFGSRIPPSLPREGASCDPVTARTPIPPKTSSLETPEGALFEPGLLSPTQSTLTGEHDSHGHRSSENHGCNGLHYGRRARSLQPLLRDISSCLA